jgi:predicted RecB family nuclease
VSDPLRGEEILACVHRVALSRGAPFDYERLALSPEMQRRRRDAEEHRQATLSEIAVLHPQSVTPSSPQETSDFMKSGAELILRPRLANDVPGRRRASVNVLIRVGRVDERFMYAPILIKNNEIHESATTRRMLEGSLTRLLPSEATFTDGVGPRSNLTVTRNGISLAHATRVLGALGHADPSARAAMIDRQRRVWWFDLASANYPRFNLGTYDEHYHQRVAVLKAHDQWLLGEGDFPTSPYWHRECTECPYSTHCELQLEQSDDVSLTRFTSLEQQVMLHEQGVDSRQELARLDPHRARQARNKVPTPRVDSKTEDFLGRTIDKLDDLIYRARAHVRGSSLRTIDSALMGCPIADVEVDVDMESYEEMTYLWGASVSLNRAVEAVLPGYKAFVEWGTLTRESEAAVFRDFWTWLSDLRQRCDDKNLTFAAYCFWAQAEDGAMNRAVATGLEGAASHEDLEAFRRASPPLWIDLHEQAKRQIQTEGPLGLKQLAGAAGFQWRDENPSGEASMLWYEVATGNDSPGALTSRQRILEYNEDDCRATKALRDWLNGPAASLPHRDDPL